MHRYNQHTYTCIYSLHILIRINKQTGEKKSTPVLKIDFSRYGKYSRELNPG